MKATYVFQPQSAWPPTTNISFSESVVVVGGRNEMCVNFQPRTPGNLHALPSPHIGETRETAAAKLLPIENALPAKPVSR